MSMDVNRAQGISPTANNSGKSGREHPSKEKTEDGDPEDVVEARMDAVEVEGLAAEITPSAQRVLDSLAAEIEPLRRQLALAKEREQNLRDDLARHAFLPIPGRREFMRELNHVLNHLNELAAMQCIALVHVANADVVRKKYGRDTLDKMLIHVSHVIGGAIQPTDVLGSLGGSDFAIILLGADINLARTRITEITTKLTSIPFRHAGDEISIDALTGIAPLSAGFSAEASINEADRDMVRQ